MKKSTKKHAMTKLLLTATLCTALMFGAAACNNENGNDVSVNVNNDDDAVVETDAPVVTEPVMPETTEGTKTE
ncbi:hypothetical protein [Paenibacillus sp. PL2-23]|uniref:hypothetical protein n=1 Tax=Paenibacillus sp. PL2-23 TaxID=2100729 RepID=UPI0030F9F370